MFRVNATDIKKEGGLFWTAVKLFQEYDPLVTYTTQPMVIKFPHPDPKERKKKKKGATISFTGLDDQEGMKSIQGINISAIMFDEATQGGEEEFWWAITRLRTEAKMSPNIWLTCNPDESSYVLKQFVHWWLYPRGTFGDVITTDIFEEDLLRIQQRDFIYVNVYEGDELVKTYDTAGHITFCETIKFFGTAGSVSVNRKAVENGVRLFTTIPRLQEGQIAELSLRRKLSGEDFESEVFSREMTVEGQEDIGGRPDIEKNGRELYYLNVDGKVHLGETLDHLYEQLPDFKDHPTIVPETVRFIGATCKDNPTYLLKNPSYESNLQNQPRQKKEQLYFGNWYAKEEGAGYFRREWVEPILDSMPDENNISRRIRCFDTAMSVPTEANNDPDWTAGVLIAATKTGEYIIEDVQRFRKRAGECEEEIMQIIRDDIDMFGSGNYKAYLPQDPAGAGIAVRNHQARMFAAEGIPVRFIKVGSQKSKLKRFEPFAASAENGLIRVLKANWNDEYFYELEKFDGTRRCGHDDQVDATSDAFNTIATNKELPKLSANKLKCS